MAPPFAGGDELPPIRHSPGHHPFALKRRTVEIEDDVYLPKRLRPMYIGPYAPYEEVAFRAADAHPFAPHPQFSDEHQQPHRRQSPHRHAHYYHQRQRPLQSHSYSHSPSRSPHRHQSPDTASCTMERTASGLSIRSEPTEGNAWTELLEDEEAEQRVRDHMANFRRRFPDSKHERILRSIINPRSNAEYPLDNDSLESIFSAANEMFFNGRLSKRVMWDWSHESSTRYDSQVIGTTALRRASNRGFETLIVLSSPILRDAKYSRRLLISTFLHELIHCYLFICCGFRARSCGGHTPAFHAIAKMIDDWAGPESALHLSKVEADLERFRVGTSEPGLATGGDEEPFRYRHHEYYPCSGITEQQEYRHHQAGGPGLDVYPASLSTTNTTTNTGHVSWRTNRAVRPLESDDDPGSPYVYTDFMSQRS